MSIISGEFVREKQFTCNLLRINAFYMQIVVSWPGSGPENDPAKDAPARSDIFLCVTKFLFMIFNELVLFVFYD